jgi:hypothetical protein
MLAESSCDPLKLLLLALQGSFAGFAVSALQQIHAAAAAAAAAIA